MKNNQDVPENDELVEISELPDEGPSPVSTRKQRRFEQTFVTLIRWSHQHRRLSVLVSSLLVGLVLLTLIGNTLLNSSHTPVKSGKPVALPTPMKGSNLYYFSPLPAWGSVSMDGRQLAHVPLPLGRNDLPLRISSGQHLLEWSVVPFGPQHCTLSVPSRQDVKQTCRVTSAPPTMFAERASLITFPVSLVQLPSDERAALIQKTQSLFDTLQSTEIIRPGERYALASDPDQTHVARESLRATLRFVLDTTPHPAGNCMCLDMGQGYIIADQNCTLFCTSFWPLTPEAGWDVLTMFHPVWQYSSLDGKPIAGSAITQRGVDSPGQFVALHVNRSDERWHVAFQQQEVSSFDDPICIGTIGQVGSNPFYQSLPGSTLRLRWAYTSSAKHAAAGCLAATPLQEGSITVQSPKAMLLYRFGVLLAANAEAHRLWPTLPLADMSEQQLARNLVQSARW